MPGFLIGKKHADFTSPDNYFEELEALIKKLLGKDDDNIFNDRSAEVLSQAILPSITISYCMGIFDNFNASQFKYKLPIFYCDAQIIACRHDGVIKRHPRISSYGHNASNHDGLVLRSSFSDEIEDRPFGTLISNIDTNGWILWADQGYSQQYLPISSRSNNRICFACSHWIKKRVYILEVHNELNDQIDRDLLIQIGYILGRRVKELYKKHLTN